jgi:hypothetical protein
MSVIIDGNFGVTSPIGIQNPQTISSNYTFGSNVNALSVGPVTIDTGYTVTVPTGSNWVIA